MAAVSKRRFADLVRDRLLDADQVREMLGYRNRQSVYDAVARGAVPPPITKLPRGYALWDRLDIEPLTTRRNDT
jgi:predicted DNA-binding transcriptional regulator AlpA